MTDANRRRPPYGFLAAVVVFPWVEWLRSGRLLPSILLAVHEAAGILLLLHVRQVGALSESLLSRYDMLLAILGLSAVSLVVRILATVGAWRRCVTPERTEGYLHLIGRRLFRDPKGVTGLVVLGALCYIVVVGPLLVSDPLIMDFSNALSSPSAQHLLGTDMYGRDLLSRIVYGARYTLGIGVTATLLNVLLGASLGLVAGFFRGAWDAIIMRVFEILNSIPFLMLAILIVAVFGSSIPMLIVVLSVFVLQPARIVRGQVLELREQVYVQAAQALGASKRRVIFRHILPNVLPTLLVVMSVRVGQNILSLAGLSFLGMGITPPTPSWGAILQEGRSHILSAPWLGAFPGLAIFVTVLGFNLLGDSLRDALDPRLGGR